MYTITQNVHFIIIRGALQGRLNSGDRENTLLGADYIYYTRQSVRHGYGGKPQVWLLLTQFRRNAITVCAHGRTAQWAQYPFFPKIFREHLHISAWLIIETDTHNTKSPAVNDNRVEPLYNMLLVFFLTYTVELRRYTNINERHSNITSYWFVKRYMFRSKTIATKRPLQNIKIRSKMLVFARSDDDRIRAKQVGLKGIIVCCVWRDSEYLYNSVDEKRWIP